MFVCEPLLCNTNARSKFTAQPYSTLNISVLGISLFEVCTSSAFSSSSSAAAAAAFTYRKWYKAIHTTDRDSPYGKSFLEIVNTEGLVYR